MIHSPARAAALALVLGLPAVLQAQDARPVAFTNARILTLSGAPIERGTVVVREGRIEAVGADATVPAGARVVDMAGGTLMPGLVSSFSRAGFVAQPQAPQPENPMGRRRGGQGGMPFPGGGGGGTANSPATKVVERLDPYQKIFGELLREGITSLALTPMGNGMPGQGAVLRPDGKNLADLTADDDAFLFFAIARDSGVKKLFKENFDKAKKALEERKKPPAPPAPPAAAPAAAAKPEEKPKEEPKPGEQPKPQPSPNPSPTPTPNPEPKPEPKPGQEPPKQEAKPAEAPKQEAPKPAPKDPNVEVLADLLDGKRRAILQVGSAADLLHWFHALEKDVPFPRTIVVPSHDPSSGTVDVVVDKLKEMKCAVLLPPTLASLPRSRYLVHPAAKLHEAGIEVGFHLGERRDQVRAIFFQLMELVRSGLPADVALRGVTLVPAKALGIDKQVGTIEVGKQANLLEFSGDPLDPASTLRGVWLGGRKVESDSKGASGS
ncbi:MAG: Atrazine chlorohydrolase [Planctomycetota bacterium]